MTAKKRMKYKDPTRGRAKLPADVSREMIGELLERAVTRAETRLEQARDDLRRWRLSNGADTNPAEDHLPFHVFLADSDD